MKIQICSDLHLEFESNRDWLKNNPIIPVGDILVIAGDTYYLERNYSKLEFIKKASNDFEKVFLIPGNHEYYGGFNVATALNSSYREIEENVFMVNNQVVKIDGVNLIFSTMWSNIQKHIWEVAKGMMDFRLIKYNKKKLTIDNFNEIHNAAFEFISNAVKVDGKKIVITHHLPSTACNVDEFKGSKLNEAFCVDKTNFILNSNIDFWIYGHSHRNLDDFKIGNTEMVTNQLGYIEWNEHYKFNFQKVIEVE